MREHLPGRQRQFAEGGPYGLKVCRELPRTEGGIEGDDKLPAVECACHPGKSRADVVQPWGVPNLWHLVAGDRSSSEVFSCGGFGGGGTSTRSNALISDRGALAAPVDATTQP